MSRALEARGVIMVGDLETIQQLQGKSLLVLLLVVLKKFNPGGQIWQDKSHQ
jgi:hypothetical protein